MKKVNDIKENIDRLQVKFAESNTRGSSLRGFRGFSSTKRGNKTDSLLTKRSVQNPAKAPKIQRETSLAKRSAFGMIFAIILTIIVAGLGILGLKFSAKTLNATTNEYIAIQLDLYLNSTAELAILYAQRNGFICVEGVDCDLGPNNISGQTAGKNKRQNPADPIEKYIEYGANGEYKFNFKMTPFDNYDEYDARVYMQSADLVSCKQDVQKPENANKRCYEIQEETKNAFLLDISGSVTNPITNQTLRVTKRQIIKP